MGGWAKGGNEGDTTSWPYATRVRKQPGPKGPTRKAASLDELGLCPRSLMFQTTQMSNGKGMIT